MLNSCRPESRARVQPVLAGARRGIDVWLAHSGAVPDVALLQRCGKILHPAELDACATYRQEADRRRAIISRALLRETLSRYASVRPSDWEFVPGAYGKPAISAPLGARLRFNLSHTSALVACAVTLDDDIGVDLEDKTRALDPLELAEHVCSSGEMIALRALAPDLQRQRFFESWTLKEAYLKARGVGFSLDPQTAAFELGEQGDIHARFAPEADDHSSDWWFALLDTQPDHVLALAARAGKQRPLVRTFLAAPGGAEAQQVEPRLYAESILADPRP